MTAITAAMVKELRERTGAAMMACKKALEEAAGNMDTAITLLRQSGEAKAAKRAGKITAEGIIVIAVSSDHKKAFMGEVNCETDFVAREAGFIEFAQAVAARGLNSNVSEIEKLLALSMTDNNTDNNSDNSSDSIEQVRLNLATRYGENISVRRAVLLTATGNGMVGHYCHGHRIGVLVSIDTHHLELAKDLAMHIAAFHPEAISPEDVPDSLTEKERAIYLAQAAETGKPTAIIEKMVMGRLQKFLKEISLVGQPFLKDTEITVGDLLKTKATKVSRFVRFEVGEGVEKETKNFADEVMAQIQGNH